MFFMLPTSWQSHKSEIEYDTDNGIVKMAEAVPLILKADTQGPTDNVEELPFIPLPKLLTVNAGDIDLCGGHWRLKRKLKREKRTTDVGQLITQMERNPTKDSFSKATAVQGKEREYREKIAS
ncbi:hypothetical protein BDF21DRAFT_401953 [Thamnidium elegans]|nr:hypothetical protein BDF21DRAFT_401953 [Thamnidium elegans]